MSPGRAQSWKGAEREQTAQKGLPGMLLPHGCTQGRSEHALLILREKDRMHFNASPLSIEKRAMCHSKVP